MTMKKIIILLAVFIYSCAQIDFEYQSNIDYSYYDRAFVVEILPDPWDEVLFDEADMMLFFSNELDRVGGFTYVTDYYDSPELADSVLPADYMVLRLEVTEYDYEIKYRDDTPDDYVAYVTVKCNVYSDENFLFSVKETGEAKEADYGGYHNDLRREAMRDALVKITQYFTKSFKI
jgi:hypothetical protein